MAPLRAAGSAECHNFSEISKWSFAPSSTSGYIPRPIHHGFGQDILTPTAWACAHPENHPAAQGYRSFFKAKAPLSKGHIAIKHWPIDVYQALIARRRLEQKIRRRLSDQRLPFFLEHAMSKLWDKTAATSIMRRSGSANDAKVRPST